MRPLSVMILLLLSLAVPITRGVEPKNEEPIRVAVYEGEGAGRSCVDLLEVLEEFEGRDRVQVIRLSAEAIREGGLSGIDVLIQPGGSGGKQGRALDSAGRETVREFVASGGGYVGICAGGYLATNHYPWSLGLIDAKVVDTRHWNRGTGMVAVELSPGGRQFFGSTERQLEIYYGQGPLLARQEWDDPEVPDYESLAVYRTEVAKNGAPRGIMAGTSAMVRADFGKGRVFVFSAHPEMTEGLGHLLTRAIIWAVNR